VSDTVRLIAAGFARYNAGDVEAVISLAAPDIHAHIPPTMANSGDYHGPEEFRVMLDHWHSAWGEYRFEVEDVVEVAPGRIVVSLRFVGRGLESGAQVDQRQGQFIEVDDGRMRQWRLFHTPEAAMQHATTL
jgi:ketosteroid isomerase-like protein